MSFDPYRKWLGIPSNRRPPTFYELLGIEPGENDSDVIRSALQQRRAFIQSKKGDGNDSEVRKILGELEEAASTLLVPEFKHGYDRHLGLHLKYKTKGNRRSYILPSWMESRVVHVYGGGSGIVGDVFGIVAILFGAFALMAWFSVVIRQDKPVANLDDQAIASPAIGKPITEIELSKAAPSVEKMPEPVQPQKAQVALAESVSDSVTMESKLTTPSTPIPSSNPTKPTPTLVDTRTKADGWKALFDGVTLTGWKALEKQSVWKVEDGSIVCSSGGHEDDSLLYIGEQRPYKNFHFACDIKSAPGSRASLFFHVPLGIAKVTIPVGFMVGINTSYAAANKTSSLWNINHIKESPVQDDEWFTQEIIVQGRQIILKVNGQIMVDYTERNRSVKNSSSKVPQRRLSQGTFALMGRSPGHITYFRNIKVKRIDR